MKVTPIRMATLAALTLLAGCGDKKPPQPLPAAPHAAVSDRIEDAIAAMEHGNALAARPILNKILTARPDDATARKLLRQMDTDPKALLGAESYAYKVKSGETLSGLAERFLDDPLMFYALARYNGIADTTLIEPGQTLRIPGEAKPVRAAAPRERPAPAVAAAPPPVAKAPPAPARNPARARQLRGAGLAALNKGQVNRAVALLQQAHQADPDNAAVTADLNRAARIRATVQGRR